MFIDFDDSTVSVKEFQNIYERYECSFKQIAQIGPDVRLIFRINKIRNIYALRLDIFIGIFMNYSFRDLYTLRYGVLISISRSKFGFINRFDRFVSLYCFIFCNFRLLSLRALENYRETRKRVK